MVLSGCAFAKRFTICTSVPMAHLLPAGALRIYDMVGTYGLLILVFLGGGLLMKLIRPAVGFFIYVLLNI